MIVDRRTFILVSAPFVAAASALTIFPTRLPGTAPSQLAAGGKDSQNVVFKIAGWDRCADVDGDCLRTSSSGPMASNTMDDEIFISVNRSWRTAWR
jgi:hypothetical protein